MSSKASNPSSLSRPISKDYPEELHHQVKRRHCCAVSVNRCLTVDAAQSPESKVVVFMFTKPANSSVTQSEKACLMVRNLHVWDSTFIQKAKSGSSRYFAALLEDQHSKKDMLLWRGPDTAKLGLQPEKAVSPRATATSPHFKAASFSGKGNLVTQ
ncbi:hypothetical protein N7456_013350 [Penicillium angulare]|uniref:Uncharacterized protein n=1 Tax=Penicillium angulare TaxID=116970 RepID=A0A9W9EG39_9EURO|nr:hypothetical protein N7456_013350 [Penicillium angulare]